MNPIRQLQEEPAEQFPDNAISAADVIRFYNTVTNPISVESVPFMARLFRLGFYCRKGLSKRLIGRPSRKLFGMLVKAGFSGTGQLHIETPHGAKFVPFEARNTQFCTLYCALFAPFYEAELCAVFDRLVGKKDVFYDIGANWGWHSLMIGNRPGFEGAIHAFEPFPPTFKDLQRVIEGAGLTGHVSCHNLALADKDGTMGMQISDGVQSGGAHLSENGVQVQMRRLDGLDLPLPKVMKIDVEGHEIDVLRGGAKLIEKARPFIVFENWAQKNDAEATFAPINWLLEAGYRLFYPGWIVKNQDCIVSAYAGTNELALVPFLPVHRFQLGDLVNVVAVPAERMQEFRSCFEAS